MKKLFLITAALMVLSSCGGEDKEFPKDYSYQSMNINAKPKSMKIRTYKVEEKFGDPVKNGYVYDSNCNIDVEFNGNGMATKARFYNEGVRLDRDEEYSYEKDNHISSVRTYDSYHDLTGKTTYEYKDGLITSIVSYDEDGSEFTKTLFYYTGGKWSRIEHYYHSELTHVDKIPGGSGKMQITHRYDKDGNETDVIYFERNNDMLNTRIKSNDYEEKIEYNDHKLPSYIKGAHIGSGLQSVFVRSYDEDNEYRYEYEYDEKGSWCKRIRYVLPEDEPDELVERKIRY